MNGSGIAHECGGEGKRESLGSVLADCLNGRPALPR